MVNIEIDGQKIRAKDGAMVIEAADAAGIDIPRFCYHKKLSIAANCRMCLVEIEKAAKPLPACATPVTEGMKIYTASPRALDAQKGVMEFLLINHPLDCPICDQGGECDLQDLAMGYGASHSRYTEKKRVIKDKYIGPLISTDMTRCIHCTRCVRFGQEIAGVMELGAPGRGEHMRIGTYVEKSVDSEVSGNVIDLCPVGALTSKPFRYTSRPWELRTGRGIAPHDCLGSNLQIQVRMNKVMRVLPLENEQINETWLSDRDRFSYEGLNSSDRLLKPLIKKDGQWEESDWETALEFTVTNLKQFLARHGAQQLGALVSPSATTEEMFLLQKLLRAIDCPNIDHRLRQNDFTDEEHISTFPWLGQSIEDLERLDAALVVGTNIRKDIPLVALRLRKAAQAGAKLMFINPVDYDFNFKVKEKKTVNVAFMPAALAAVYKALTERANVTPAPDVAKLIAPIEIDDTHRRMAEVLASSSRSTVLLGVNAFTHPAFSSLRLFAHLIAELAGAKLGYLSPNANTSGAWLAGAVPHRGAGGQVVNSGLNAKQMLEKPLKGFFLQGIEPEFDCADPALAIKTLEQADFVVSLTAYDTEAIRRYATVMLPIAPFTETSGTFINVEGRWQSFVGVVASSGNVRPAWKILRVLGNLLNVPGFDYVTSEDVRDEIYKLAGDSKPSNRIRPVRYPNELVTIMDGIVRLADIPIYGVDAIVRRSLPLQKTKDAAEQKIARLNAATAARLGIEKAETISIRQENNHASVSFAIDERVPFGCLALPAAIAEVKNLGANGALVQIENV